MRGAQGARGDVGGDIPDDSVIYYDGNDTPEGYEDTQPPELNAVVSLTQAQYEALTDEEKNNGTLYVVPNATKIDLGQVAERVSAASQNITASSELTNCAAWCAFNGVSPTDYTESGLTNNTVWKPDTINDSAPYIIYELEKAAILSKISLGIFCNEQYSGYYYTVEIQGSNDGTTWNDIEWAGGVTSSTILFTGYENYINKSGGTPSPMDYYIYETINNSYCVSIPLSGSTAYKYYKVLFVNGLNDKCCIDEIFLFAFNAVRNENLIYYKKIVYVSAENIYKQVTQDQYDALPSTKESDGVIYFINN